MKHRFSILVATIAAYSYLSAGLSDRIRAQEAGLYESGMVDEALSAARTGVHVWHEKGPDGKPVRQQRALTLQERYSIAQDAHNLLRSHTAQNQPGVVNARRYERDLQDFQRLQNSLGQELDGRGIARPAPTPTRPPSGAQVPDRPPWRGPSFQIFNRDVNPPPQSPQNRADSSSSSTGTAAGQAGSNSRPTRPVQTPSSSPANSTIDTGQRSGRSNDTVAPGGNAGSRTGTASSVRPGNDTVDTRSSSSGRTSDTVAERGSANSRSTADQNSRTGRDTMDTRSTAAGGRDTVGERSTTNSRTPSDGESRSSRSTVDTRNAGNSRDTIAPAGRSNDTSRTGAARTSSGELPVLDPNDPRGLPRIENGRVNAPQQGGSASAEENTRREFIVKRDGTVVPGRENPVDSIGRRETVVQVDPNTGNRTYIHGPDVPDAHKRGIEARMDRELNGRINQAVNDRREQMDRVNRQTGAERARSAGNSENNAGRGTGSEDGTQRPTTDVPDSSAAARNEISASGDASGRTSAGEADGTAAREGGSTSTGNTDGRNASGETNRATTSGDVDGPSAATNNADGSRLTTGSAGDGTSPTGAVDGSASGATGDVDGAGASDGPGKTGEVDGPSRQTSDVDGPGGTGKGGIGARVMQGVGTAGGVIGIANAGQSGVDYVEGRITGEELAQQGADAATSGLYGKLNDMSAAQNVLQQAEADAEFVRRNEAERVLTQAGVPRDEISAIRDAMVRGDDAPLDNKLSELNQGRGQNEQLSVSDRSDLGRVEADENYGEPLTRLPGEAADATGRALGFLGGTAGRIGQIGSDAAESVNTQNRASQTEGGLVDQNAQLRQAVDELRPQFPASWTDEEILYWMMANRDLGTPGERPIPHEDPARPPEPERPEIHPPGEDDGKKKDPDVRGPGTDGNADQSALTPYQREHMENLQPREGYDGGALQDFMEQLSDIPEQAPRNPDEGSIDDFADPTAGRNTGQNSAATGAVDVRPPGGNNQTPTSSIDENAFNRGMNRIDAITSYRIDGDYPQASRLKRALDDYRRAQEELRRMKAERRKAEQIAEYNRQLQEYYRQLAWQQQQYNNWLAAQQRAQHRPQQRSVPQQSGGHHQSGGLINDN